MGRGIEQTFSPRRYTSGQQVHENVLNIANHQGNSDQNHKEISPPTCQNGYHQKDNCWQEYGEKEMLVHGQWECMGGIAMMEILQKIKNRTTIQSHNPTSGCISKENKNQILKTYLPSHVYCSIIHNSQDMVTVLSIHRRMNGFFKM